ncbi:hypothetical protein ACLOJK_020984 [Asimina triloba]
MREMWNISGLSMRFTCSMDEPPRGLADAEKDAKTPLAILANWSRKEVPSPRTMRRSTAFRLPLLLPWKQKAVLVPWQLNLVVGAAAVGNAERRAGIVDLCGVLMTRRRDMEKKLSASDWIWLWYRDCLR